MTNISIDDVVVTRGREPEPLPEGLGRSVYSKPLILRADKVLVDGYRRLQRAKDLGRTEIPAIVSSDFPVLAQALTDQHDPAHPVLPQRMWEIYDCIFTLGVAWSRSFVLGGWRDLGAGKRERTKPKGKRPPEHSARLLLVKAFNCPENYLATVIHVYRHAAAGNLVAQKLVREINAGQTTPTKAMREMQRPYNLVGNVVGREDQERLLERGTAALSAQTDALMRLGNPIQLSAKEVVPYIETMHEVRRNLTTMINGLRKFVKEEEQNG